MSDNNEYRTAKTSLAAYLVSEGFTLIIIEYDSNDRGTYVFDSKNPKLFKLAHLYDSGEAIGNIALFEHARNSLIARVKRGLP